MGSSLGGLISAYAGVKRAALFGRIGAMSPSTWWDELFLLGSVRGSGAVRPLRVYLDSGDSGPSMDDKDNTQALAQVYRDLGYRDGVDLLHVIQRGASHSEYYWAQRLPIALQFLLAGL
jgi:pullulanase